MLRTEIMRAFLNGQAIVNDHTNRNIEVVALAEYVDPEMGYSAILNHPIGFSLNEVYLDDNNVLHLSKRSNAGTVSMNGRMPFDKFHLEAYNEPLTSSPLAEIFRKRRISKVTFRDGSVIEADLDLENKEA